MPNDILIIRILNFRQRYREKSDKINEPVKEVRVDEMFSTSEISVTDEPQSYEELSVSDNRNAYQDLNVLDVRNVYQNLEFAA